MSAWLATVSSGRGDSSSSISTHSRPFSLDCWALSEKSEPASLPSIISTSRSQNVAPSRMSIRHTVTASVYPITGAELAFDSELPDDMQAVLDALRALV